MKTIKFYFLFCIILIGSSSIFATVPPPPVPIISSIVSSTGSTQVCKGATTQLEVIIEPSSINYSQGDVGPNGGNVTLDKGNDNNGWRYLQIAPFDIELPEALISSFGCACENVTANNNDQGGGYDNFQAWLTSSCAAEWLHYIDTLHILGFDDWYIPSLTELNGIYDLATNQGLNYVAAFQDDFYWTSSAADFGNCGQSGGIYQKSMQTGIIAPVDRNSSIGRIRLVRRFSNIPKFLWSNGSTESTTQISNSLEGYTEYNVQVSAYFRRINYNFANGSFDQNPYFTDYAGIGINVYPIIQTFNETITAGDSIFFNGTYLKEAGTYSQEFTTSQGCDSTIVFNLNVIQPQIDCSIGVEHVNNQWRLSLPYFDPESPGFADNTTTYTWSNGSSASSVLVSQNGSGVYTVSLSNGERSCEASIGLKLNQPSTTTIDTTLSAGQSIVFNGENLNQSGTYTATLQNAAGCDSLVTLNLVVNSVPTSCSIEASSQTVCLGNSVDLSISENGFTPCAEANSNSPQWELLFPASSFNGNEVNFKPGSFDKANSKIYSVLKTGSVNRVYCFDLNTNQVTEIPSNGGPGELYEAVYDFTNQRIVANRVGRDAVYSLPSTGGTWSQIGGGNFDAESYGANTFWNPINQRFSYFGGYGFFAMKNWIWENNGSGWQNTYANNNNCTPGKRGGQFSLNAAGDKIQIFSGQGSCDGNQFASSCSLGSPWASDVGVYCWFRDIWELDLNTLQFSNILPVNSQSISREGAFAYDYENDDYYIIGGFVPSGNYSTNVNNYGNSWSNEVLRFKRGEENGFSPMSVSGTIPPVSNNSIGNGTAIFDANYNRIILARKDGIWALNLSNCDKTYSWSTGETTPTISVSPNATTTYSVTVSQGTQTCSSDITITVNQPSATTETVSACGSFTWKGNSYTQSGTYTWTGTNAAGCDSLVTLNLTITPQPVQPPTACYETATFNPQTCSWNVTGAQPVQPPTACYQTATFNTQTCTWDVTGTQPVQPATACYQTATFNTQSCSWDVTGSQPAQPATACYQTATFNTQSCSWDVTGTQPVQPATACYQTATFNTQSCSWDVTGTQPTQPATACYETATFNSSTCSWDVTGSPVPAIVTTASACDNYTWSVNGQSYTASGNYTYSENCQDYILNLTVNQATTSTINAIINQGGSYSFNGQNLTTAGTYTATLQNAAGCDSLVTLNLTVNPVVEAGCYASTVVDFVQGLNSTGGVIPSIRSNATQALGQPEAVVTNVVNFVTLGFGGTITLAFETPIANGAGNDIRLDETTWGNNPCSRNPEKADVFASQDGTNFIYLGQACQDASFDLGTLSWAKYIRLVDVSNSTSFNGDGYDLNGIECLNGSATNPSNDGLQACTLQEIVSYAPGNRKNGTAVPSPRNDANSALGEPQSNNTINFVALGFGGSLIGKFDYVVFNQPGNDLRVTETSFGNPGCTNYPEKARVSLSLDNQNWIELGEICQDGTIEMGTMPYAQYIRIQDASPMSSSKFNKTADGYDLDAVVVLNNGCSAAAARLADADNTTTPNEESGISVFPNPMQEFTTIRFDNLSEDSEFTLELFDGAGRLIQTQKIEVSADMPEFTMKASDLAHGIYQVVIHNETTRFMQRLVK